jgi:uncharacterized protein YggE
VLVSRGDGDEASAEAIKVTPSGGSVGIVSGGGATAQPVSRLPGITVLGMGDVEVKSDVALVRLTVGSGSDSFSGGSVELIDEKQLRPVVDALVDAGAKQDDIYVNTFTGYGSSEGAAQLTIKWSRPQEMNKLLAAAQRAIRKQTGFDLSAVSVNFLRDDCDGPEAKATAAALADARGRAERLASLSDQKVGRLISVSEAGSAGSLIGYGPQRCGVDAALASGGLGLFDYQTGTSTADEVMVSTTLEVTFALDEP